MNPSWRTNYIRYKSYFFNVVGKYRDRKDMQAYLEILLSLATVSIFSVFALRPTLLTIAQLITEIDSKRDTLAKMNEKIQNLKKAQNLYDQERAKISLLQQAIPAKPNPVIYARQIEGLAAKHQIQISRMSSGEAAILGSATSETPNQSEEESSFPDGAGKLEFSLEITSSTEQYQSIENFLSDVEKLRLPLKLDSLIINTESQEEAKNLLMSINGKLPFFKGNGQN